MLVAPIAGGAEDCEHEEHTCNCEHTDQQYYGHLTPPIV
jgi:hypothetical protein